MKNKYLHTIVLGKEDKFKYSMLRMIKPFYSAWGWKIPASGYG